MKRLRRLALATLVCAAVGCSGSSSNELSGVDKIIYIQRTGSELGNVFEYARGGAASDQADIYALSPPSASGVRTNITHLPAGSDIQSMDLSFDATQIVFSARMTPADHYHLYRINLDGSNPCEAGKTGACQITDGPYDETYPIFIPGDRIFFTSNQCVEKGAKQFMDEYERATTAQLATITLSGSDLQLGARNVSHRVSPTLMSDGRVLFTQWDHLGESNAGNLLIVSQDMTGNREGFGKEGKGIANSYLRAREIQPGQFVAVATSRDRTFQAGKLAILNLGTVNGDGTVNLSTLSEANSSAIDLTPDIPADRVPSFNGVGRYYDAYPVGTPSQRRFLASWSDGPVETEVLGMAGTVPSFGIYLFDGVKNTRFPVAVPPPGSTSWYVSPIVVAQRAEPPMLDSSSNMVSGTTQSTLISAINVYDSSLFQIPPGSVKKVRLMEGFSDEEGFPGDFGLTEFDGHSMLGEIDLGGDGSFKALVPANTPIHIQLVDQYGMAIESEPIWIQGRPGEARVCGGCHEDRTKTPQLMPGSSALQATAAAALDLPRAQRVSMDFSPAKVKGVPWDKALQPIFDAHCIDCHNGQSGSANPSYTVKDVTDMLTFSWTFDLRGQAVNVKVGDMMYGYSASHLSLLGPAMMFREKQVEFVGGSMPQVYVEPGSARDSVLIQMLNPPVRYPTVNLASRYKSGQPQHPAELTASVNGHDPKDPKYQLNGDEYYLLELMADMGGQYYSRENAPGGTY